MTSANPVISAHSLQETILKHRLETEANRRVASPIVEALIDAGLNRLAISQKYRGLALPVVETLRVYESLARAEPSVGWVVWNNSLPCLFSRFLDEPARIELFENPIWLYANSTRPSGKAIVEDGGYRIHGRWSLVSGCELAEWMALMCIVEENGQVRFLQPEVPEMRLVFLHKDDIEILDTWYAGGLRGTGSHDVRVEGCHVRAEHTLSPVDPATLDEPIGRVPITSTLAAGFAAQMIGVAQAALDTVIELGRTKTSPDPTPDMRDRSTVQISVASLAPALNAARLYVHEALQKVWEKASAGESASLEDITEVWTASLHADQLAREVVDAAYAAGGTTSVYQSCPLERAHRDARVMLQHVISQPVWLEDAGRFMLGLQPTNPLYAI